MSHAPIPGGALSRALHLGRRAKAEVYAGLLAGTTALRGRFDAQARLVQRTNPALQASLVQWVPTAAVRLWTMPDRWPEPYASEFIVAGDWDVERVGGLDYYRRNSRNYRSALQIFEQHLPVEQCDQYRFLAQVIRDGSSHPEMDERGATMDDVDAYFARLVTVYHEMAAHGYLSQADLGKHDDVPDEIRVLVDRNGKLVRAFGGNHRFAMAQLLGVPWIPVYVLGVHRQWARGWFDDVGGGLLAALRRGLASLASTGGTGTGRCRR